ncbi:MAG: hypothetical protein KC649_07980, partial [Candidatus Omnitrophica bacterium]|nr:hypothetical protein [Candidatus Omnitrophota bacterium]
ILLFALAAVASIFTRAFLKKQKKTESSQAQPVRESRIRRIIRSIFGLSILFIVLSANSLYPTQIMAQEAVVAPIADLQSEARGIVDEIRVIQTQEISSYQSYLRAKEAYEQNREGYRYTRNKYVTLMQTSWNAVGGTRNESEVHEPLVDSQGRKIAARKGRYRFPVESQGAFDKIEWYRYFTIGAPDKSGHQGEIVDQYTTLSDLPEAAQKALRDSPAPYYAPNGAVFAQYFSAVLVNQDGVPEVGFRFGGVNQDGTYRVETVPAQWGTDHPKAMNYIRKFGIGAPVFVEARAITKGRYEKLKAATAKYPELGVSTYYDKDSGVYYEVSSGQDGRWNRLGAFFFKTDSGIDFSLQLIRGTHTTFGGINEDAHLAA